MNKNLSCVVLGVFVATVYADSALAQFNFISQKRYVSIPPEAIVAPDFGPFNESLAASFATASQESVLEPSSISVVADTNFGNQGLPTALFFVEFSLDADYVGHYKAAISGFSGPVVSLKFPNGDELIVQAPPSSFPSTIDEQVVLPAGMYTLSGLQTFTGSFSASLEITGQGCYADCDESGSLNIDDFICFQTLYAIGDPTADCDESGSLDIDDFICFQTLYAIGC